VILRGRRFFPDFHDRKFVELGLSLLVGLLFGALVVIPPYLPLPSDWQKLVMVVPFGFAVVMLVKNLDRLILAAMAISVPLNLDFSLIISPYGRTTESMANGRTIMALTGLRLSLILIIVIVGYVLWLVERRNASRPQVHFFASTTIPALGLILISVLSVLQAQDVQLSFFKIAQLAELFLVYFYLANHLRTKQDLQFFVVVLMGAMLAESILMILQWFTGLTFSFAGIRADVHLNPTRPAGTLGAADVAGGILSAQLAMVCAMLWYFPRRSQKTFAGICFIVGFIALISTAGRAAWGSFIVVIIGFVLIGRRRGWVARRSLIWMFLISLVIGGIFSTTIYDRLTEDDHGSAASRIMMFQLAWNVIQSSPSHFLLGVGANNYALVAPEFNKVIGGIMGYTIQDISVHNVFLLTWAETGLIGLFTFLGLLAAPLVKTWKHIQSGEKFSSLMAIGLGCALVAISIQMLVDPFIARPLAIFVWLMISLIASLDNIIPKQVVLPVTSLV
jgi:O-antigen ligase